MGLTSLKVHNFLFMTTIGELSRGPGEKRLVGSDLKIGLLGNLEIKVRDVEAFKTESAPRSSSYCAKYLALCAAGLTRLSPTIRMASHALPVTHSRGD